MRIAVLFDGAGLARLGLEQAGHETVGVELNPVMHHLAKSVGNPKDLVLGDVRDFDLSGFDAVWASPPCQKRSRAREYDVVGDYAEDLLAWSLGLDKEVLWVENIYVHGKVDSEQNRWGKAYNAVQFRDEPRQNRNRIIGGRYPLPSVYREYKLYYRKFVGSIPPTVTATEYKGGPKATRRAARFYGRRLTIDECAYHQGFEVPDDWREVPEWWEGTEVQWEQQLYHAIGNGVPVAMAKAFGEALNDADNKDWFYTPQNVIGNL